MSEKRKNKDLRFLFDLSAGKALSSIKALWDGFIFNRRKHLEVSMEPTYKSFGKIWEFYVRLPAMPKSSSLTLCFGFVQQDFGSGGKILFYFSLSCLVLNWFPQVKSDLQTVCDPSLPLSYLTAFNSIFCLLFPLWWEHGVQPGSPHHTLLQGRCTFSPAEQIICHLKVCGFCFG